MEDALNSERRPYMHYSGRRNRHNVKRLLPLPARVASQLSRLLYRSLEIPRRIVISRAAVLEHLPTPCCLALCLEAKAGIAGNERGSYASASVIAHCGASVPPPRTTVDFLWVSRIRIGLGGCAYKGFGRKWMGNTPRMFLVEHDGASYTHLSASVSELFLDVLNLVMHFKVPMPDLHEHRIRHGVAQREVHVF